MKRVGIVNFANNRGNYLKMQDRLKFSLDAVGFEGSRYFYNDESEIHPDCPTHEDVPYGFKPWAMQNAINDGCDIVIWMDAAVYATKSLADFIQHIEREGYAIFQNLGFTIGDFTTDACLEYFGWDREKSFHYPMSMACLQGINVHNVKAMEWFKRYFQAAKDKVPYQGPWDNVDGGASSDSRCMGARHDQSCASIIAADLNMKMIVGQDTYFAYVDHKSVMKISNSVAIWSQGL